MRYTADFIYTPDGLLQSQVLEINAAGYIAAVRPKVEGEDALHFDGILCPPFVNAHCHLELSILQGQIPMHTGMTGFAQGVVSQRRLFSDTDAQNAIIDTIQNARKTGTGYIGDICNAEISIAPKHQALDIYFHSFVEVFGMREEKAQEIWEKGVQLLAQFQVIDDSNHSSSMTLHAPYSLSSALIQIAARQYKASPAIASIHFKESQEEVEIFEKGTGAFAEFYRNIGLSFEGFSVKTPFAFVSPAFSTHQPILWVHNTACDASDIAQISAQFPHSYFCLCPRSNLFIHHTLPDMQAFASVMDRVCLGTDSLASNHSIEILEEAKCLQTHFPHLSLQQLLDMLIVNGRAALGLQRHLGAFQVGEKAECVHISHIDTHNMKFTKESKAVRIALE